jgi:hypothetical protein
LKKRGYVSYAGYQVQENLQIPTCCPGLVYVRAEEITADPKKMKTVSLEGGSVKICWNKVKVAKSSFLDKGKRWDDFEVRDMEILRRFSSTPSFSHVLAGIGCSGARPMVSARSAYNQSKALLGRVFRLPSEREWGRGPKPGTWKWAAQFVDYLLPDFRTSKMSVEDWIASMPARRRSPLKRAAERYRQSGWRRSYEKFSSFVKTELLPGFGKSDVELTRLTGMIDRLIQGPADETHVIAGPYLKPLVYALKKIWGPDSAIFYGSAGPEALHKFLEEKLIDGARQYFWCDFSMYDNTHSEESWEFMAKLYRRAGIHDSDFWRVFEAWKAPRGTIGPFKYQARVMNASGRDDTALANGILNGFATYLSVAAAWLEIELEELTPAMLAPLKSIIVLSVCGDDSLGSIPPMPEEFMIGFRKRVAQNIAKFGFEAKLETSTRLCDAVYLGMRPYPVAGRWFWGKTIGRATYKMGWVVKKDNADAMAHITGIADMHCLCSRHVPVLSDLAAKIVELRKGAKRTPITIDPDRPWEWTLKGEVEYDYSTLEHVATTYTRKGVTVRVDDVLDLIKKIRAIERLPQVLDHWLWRHMIHADDL